MLRCMKTETDAFSAEAIAKQEGTEAFYKLIGVGGCPYDGRPTFKMHWLAGWLEAFSGQCVNVEMGPVSLPRST